jgi:RND family efflux transporter MFP subunit
MMTPKLPKHQDTLDNTDTRASQTPPSNQGKANKFSLSPWPIIFGLVLLAVGVGWGGKWWLASRASKNGAPFGAFAAQPQAIPVKIETLKNAILENSTEVVGTLKAPRSLILKSEVEGRVSQILVQEGARVKAGQAIFRLESNDLQAELFQAKAKLENAKARLAQLETGNRPEDIAEARAKLNQVQARLSNAKSGARPEEIAQAQAQVDSAQAEVDLAQERVKRYRNLQEEGAVSQDQFDELLKKERSTKSALTEAERRLAQLRKGRESDLDGLAAEVEQARQNLKRLENGARIEEIAQAKADVAQAVAAVKMIEVNIKKTQVVAPFAGIIGDIPLKLGDYVSSGDELTTVTENNVLEVNLSIPLEKSSELRLGLPVEILDAQGQTETTGEISFISPDVTANSQLVLAKATIKNASGNLFNRQLVQGKVIWDKRPGILVPSAAISRVGGQNFVFVAQSISPSKSNSSQLIAKQKQVKLGSIQGNDYQVLEGLKAGDKIVTAGILNLRDETPIQPLPPEK